ncbi:11402_t:CDS:2 [Funneliformis geosporum]|uniref:7762_t:CDS:1 n=1 Tax=Funneliformis geosporum TaxID=1117311 RepID=A0A9W4SDP1_9GLOM|nr:11402_t:CDS:2 [Funneliformis geosporum]CAI2164775.1 7762_t:CDS:2 [Funneliformis geosporum]
MSDLLSKLTLPAPTEVPDIFKLFPKIRKWTFPKMTLSTPPQKLPELTLIGTSRAADSTSFYIPELNWLFDGGTKVTNYFPSHIFITHTHTDHCLALCRYNSRRKPPTIYAPMESVQLVENFMRSAQAITDNYALRRGDSFSCLGVKQGDKITLFLTSSKSYIVYSKRKRLSSAYKHMTTKEIAKFRQENPSTEIMEPYLAPLFAFNGDTTINAFFPNRTNDKGAFKEVPVIITECSFLLDEHLDQAKKTKHTHWKDLKKIVKENRTQIFILIHFSCRYSEDSIRNFFEEERKKIREETYDNYALENVVIWV